MGRYKEAAPRMKLALGKSGKQGIKNQRHQIEGAPRMTSESFEFRRGAKGEEGGLGSC